MEQYREALKILNVGKQQQLKQQMLESAKERIFYLSTLTHHAGMLLIHKNYNLVYSITICILILCSRWSETSYKGQQVNSSMY